MSDNAWFRKQARLLIDALKLPENTDLLDIFIHYNAREEGSWINFQAPRVINEWEIEWMKRYPTFYHLTSEQSQRWEDLVAQFDFYHDSGMAYYSTVLILAQLMLGRWDVLNE